MCVCVCLKILNLNIEPFFPETQKLHEDICIFKWIHIIHTGYIHSIKRMRYTHDILLMMQITLDRYKNSMIFFFRWRVRKKNMSFYMHFLNFFFAYAPMHCCLFHYYYYYYCYMLILNQIHSLSFCFWM